MYQVTVYEREYNEGTKQCGSIKWIDKHYDVTYIAVKVRADGSNVDISIRTAQDPTPSYYRDITDLLINPRFGPVLHVCTVDNPNWAQETMEYLAREQDADGDDYMEYQEVMKVLDGMPKISPLVSIQIRCNDGNPNQFYVHLGCTGFNRYGAQVDVEHRDISNPMEFEKLLYQVNCIAKSLTAEEDNSQAVALNEAYSLDSHTEEEDK